MVQNLVEILGRRFRGYYNSNSGLNLERDVLKVHMGAMVRCMHTNGHIYIYNFWYVFVVCICVNSNVSLFHVILYTCHALHRVATWVRDLSPKIHITKLQEG